MSDEKKYYYLKKGEIIQEGDEVEVSNSIKDEPKWQKTNCVGGLAPDQQYPAHRIYRRLITDEFVEKLTNEAKMIREAQSNGTLTISGINSDVKYKVPNI
jgi:hypothetical protein